jgi:hypothetical protein
MSNVRTITVFATRGQNVNKFESSASTWGEFKGVLSNAGYELDSLKATESVNKSTLDLDGAALPDGDFKIFLRPEKTKAGSLVENITGSLVEDMSYDEVRGNIKDIIEAHPEDGAFFNVGRNYTTKSAATLRTLLQEWEEAQTHKIALKTLSNDGLVALYDEVMAEVKERGLEEECDAECQEVKDLTAEAKEIFGEEV